ASDGEDRGVLLLAGEPVDEFDGGAVRAAVPLDGLRECQDVARLPFGGRSRGEARRLHAQGDRPVDEPFEFGGGGPAGPDPEGAEDLVELEAALLDAFAFGEARAAAEDAADAFAQVVEHGPAREGDAEVGLAFGVGEGVQVALRGDEVLGPAGAAGDGAQRVGGVLVDGAGPFVGRERLGGAPEVEAHTGEAGELLGYGGDEGFAFQVWPEGPAHGGEHVPGGDGGGREGGVPGDLAERELAERLALLVLLDRSGDAGGLVVDGLDDGFGARLLDGDEVLGGGAALLLAAPFGPARLTCGNVAASLVSGLWITRAALWITPCSLWMTLWIPAGRGLWIPLWTSLWITRRFLWITLWRTCGRVGSRRRWRRVSCRIGRRLGGGGPGCSAGRRRGGAALLSGRLRPEDGVGQGRGVVVE